MMKVYGDSRSGNCLKVKYVLDYIGIAYEWEEIDVLSGYTRTPDYLSIDPAGQIPCVVLDDGRPLSQSGAIIRYFAKGSDLIPDDDYLQAKMDEWMFWEQYSHETAIAVVRFHHALKGTPLSDIDPALIDKGYAALDRMELALNENDWLVGDRLSLADVALVAYTQFAHEGGFDMGRYPAIKKWLCRVGSALGIR